MEPVSSLGTFLMKGDCSALRSSERSVVSHFLEHRVESKGLGAFLRTQCHSGPFRGWVSQQVGSHLLTLSFQQVVRSSLLPPVCMAQGRGLTMVSHRVPETHWPLHARPALSLDLGPFEIGSSMASRKR